jgi:GxxExxY protein
LDAAGNGKTVNSKIRGVGLRARNGKSFAAGFRGFTRMRHDKMASTGTLGRLEHAETTREILVTFFEVYNELGDGFLESIYQTALARALAERGLHVDQRVPIDVFFRHAVIGRFFADLVVENRVIVEVKAVRTLASGHQSQLLHYLRATAMEVGLLLNFGPAPQYKRLIFSNSRKRLAPARQPA